MLRFCKAIRPIAGFHVDQAPTNSRYTAELFATVRNNGRILDEVRCVLGGNETVEADFPLAKLYEDDNIKEWTVKMQKWPRDIDLRRGLLSGQWVDMRALVTTRDACILDKDGAGITASAFLKALDSAEDGPEEAAVRWAVVLGDSGLLVVQLQGLPGPAATLNGKPALKR
jgi:hypothetical protein